MNNIGISCYISFESIYRDSLATLKFTALSNFSIKLSSEVVAYIKGKQINEYIAAEKIDGNYHIELDVIGIFKERDVISPNGNPAINHYGMRFYPFLSSLIDLTITTDKLPIFSVIIELPDSFRFIWYSANVLDPNDVKAERRHSFGIDRSKYVFSWATRPEVFGIFKINVPVRLGGHTLVKLIEFPVYYWILTLMGVAIASYEKSTVFLAAMGAAWVFMVKWWFSSNLPQQNTIMTHGYIIASIFIPIWGISWKIFGWGALILALPVMIALLYLSNSLKVFKTQGVLPDRLARYWYNKINKQDLAQRDI